MINDLNTSEFPVSNTKRPPGSGFSALVVEEQALIALDLELLLHDLGAGQVEIAASVEHAFQLLNTTRFDVAFLDIRLGQTTTIPVAAALRDLQVPFAIVTGSTVQDAIVKDLRAHAMIGKPFRATDVSEAIDVLLSSRME
jgi:CheY-like chemotaxis protein